MLPLLRKMVRSTFDERGHGAGGGVSLRCWGSLRQFEQVDFLPIFMTFYEDVERLGAPSSRSRQTYI